MVKLLRTLTVGIYQSLTGRDQQRKIRIEIERWQKEVEGQTTARHRRCQCPQCRRERSA